MSQSKQLHSMMKRRWVTSMDAFGKLNITALHRRISDLKAQGVEIESKWIKRDGVRFKKYRVKK